MLGEEEDARLAQLLQDGAELVAVEPERIPQEWE